MKQKTRELQTQGLVGPPESAKGGTKPRRGAAAPPDMDINIVTIANKLYEASDLPTLEERNANIA